MMIQEDNSFIDKCKTISEAHVFIEISKSMDQSQLWFSNADSREKICTKLSISDIRFKQILKQLVNSGLLHKKMKGIYLVSQVYMSIQKEEK